MKKIMDNKKINDIENNNEKINQTQVVNVKVTNIRPKYQNLSEWMKNFDMNCYIGRKGVVFIDGSRFPLYDSIWANPYKITQEQSREQVLLLYAEYIEKKIESDNNLINELLKLKGKNLGCWCKPECCHGDILIDLIKKYDKNN